MINIRQIKRFSSHKQQKNISYCSRMIVNNPNIDNTITFIIMYSVYNFDECFQVEIVAV